jgi:biotin carboxylase
MSSLADVGVVLVMRTGLSIRFDHIECMSRLGLVIHVVTQEEQAAADPRFATVMAVGPDCTTADLSDVTLRRMTETGASCATTFQETDIVAVGQANARAGMSWARPDADAIARDKSRQRHHLVAHGIPSPGFVEVRDVDTALAGLAGQDGPWIVKPTRGASSSHVSLVTDHDAVRSDLSAIRTLASTTTNNFYEGIPEVWALIEEYLPGDEVTCDGVVIDGEFHLGGIHGKHVGDGPWFEEDLYTLPLPDRGAEREIVGIVERLVASLDVVHSLFNVELRRGADGAYRVVEFSTRISGGHVYRNILDVHAVDLIDLYLHALLDDPGQAARDARQRHAGRMATCIRMVYRTGVVRENCAGPAANDSAFRAYYPLVAVGERVASAPLGFDMCGLLSVREPLRVHDHPERVHATARRLEDQLSLRVD